VQVANQAFYFRISHFKNITKHSLENSAIFSLCLYRTFDTRMEFGLQNT